MKAFVGIYVARLHLPWARTRKEKRAAIRPIVERLRARHGVSAARLAGVDAEGWEVIGFTTIGGGHAQVETVIRDAARTVASGEGDYQIAREWRTVDDLDLGDLGGFVG